jgi:methylated-DNA-[protein]-cysteine S-methyltransferase
MSPDTMTERRAVERIVLNTYGRLTGRAGEPMRYAMMEDTPVGVLGLAAGEAGLRRLDFVKDEATFVEWLFDSYGDRPILRSDDLDKVRRALDRYFAGDRLTFDLAVDLSDVSGFHERVLRAAVRIPVGEVLTYTEIAAKAGNPRASRAAGNALHNNPVAIIVPCHRIVRSDGSLGGYGGGLHVKEYLLKHEGVLLV